MFWHINTVEHFRVTKCDHNQSKNMYVLSTSCVLILLSIYVGYTSYNINDVMWDKVQFKKKIRELYDWCNAKQIIVIQPEIATIR